MSGQPPSGYDSSSAPAERTVPAGYPQPPGLAHPDAQQKSHLATEPSSGTHPGKRTIAFAHSTAITSADQFAGQARASLLLGGLSVMVWLIPLVGMPLSIIGITLHAGGASSYEPRAAATVLSTWIGVMV